MVVPLQKRRDAPAVDLVSYERRQARIELVAEQRSQLRQVQRRHRRAEVDDRMGRIGQRRLVRGHGPTALLTDRPGDVQDLVEVAAFALQQLCRRQRRQHGAAPGHRRLVAVALAGARELQVEGRGQRRHRLVRHLLRLVEDPVDRRRVELGTDLRPVVPVAPWWERRSGRLLGQCLLDVDGVVPAQQHRSPCHDGSGAQDVRPDDRRQASAMKYCSGIVGPGPGYIQAFRSSFGTLWKSSFTIAYPLGGNSVPIA